jgi:hypothetical protein
MRKGQPSPLQKPATRSDGDESPLTALLVSSGSGGGDEGSDGLPSPAKNSSVTPTGHRHRRGSKNSQGKVMDALAEWDPFFEADD